MKEASRKTKTCQPNLNICLSLTNLPQVLWDSNPVGLAEFRVPLPLPILYNWSESVKHAPGKKSKEVRYFLGTKRAKSIFNVVFDKHSQNMFYFWTIRFLVAGSKEIGTGSGNSSISSGSGVLVPSVDDKDVDWDDDDDDLDLNEDMDEEEVKKIMQSMATKKQSGDDGTGDPDVSHWIENVEFVIP